MKISHVCLKQNIFLKIINDSQNIFTIFFVSEVFNKNVIFNVNFNDNSSVTHIFIKQIYRAAEQAPLSPTWLCEGGGEVAVFIL
jgi:hypothetical protein